MNHETRMGAVVVTVSDGVARGVRKDTAGEAVAALLQEHGFALERRHVVPDERGQIGALLRKLADNGCPLVVTTGGTGLGPRDVTPEATREIIDREIPGLAEEMRAAGRESTPFAALSRQVVGARGATLIVNLPGSESGAVEGIRAILPALPHALRLLAGDTVHGPADATDAQPSAQRHAEAASRDRGPIVPTEHRHAESTVLGDGAAAEHRPPAAAERHPASHAETEAGPSPRSIEEELAARREARQEVVLATAVRTHGSPPCRVGQKLLLSRGALLAGTLGCAEFDDAAVHDAARVLDAGTATTATYHHELGTIDVYLEPFPRRPRLVVFGATPVARSLVRWAREVGFDPVLVEPRSERITDADRATGILAASLEGVEVGTDAAAVHTDHDAPFAVETLADLLRSPARFIGMMGSARHVGPHLDRLRTLGFTEADLARVRTPVGLDIGARTPEEIALSILAGLVADRSDAGGGWLDRRDPATAPTH